jgi:predicted NAD/FAD-binding protein
MGGTSLSALFAQREIFLRPSFWRMIFDIIRFNQFALDLLSAEEKGSTGVQKEQSIGNYLEKEGYSANFRDDHIIPMTAYVWTGPGKCALEFPAMTLVRFVWNHHLLNIFAARPPRFTIEGGTQKYIDAVKIYLSTPVVSIRNQKDGKVIVNLGGKT